MAWLLFCTRTRFLFSTKVAFCPLLFVPLVWLANLLFSNLWLRYFSQGPAEWLWRRLTLMAACKAEPKIQN